MSPADRLAILALFVLVAAGVIYLTARILAACLAARQARSGARPERERRRHGRRAVARVVAVLSPEGSADEARVQNIGPGGMCLEVRTTTGEDLIQATIVAPGRGCPLTAQARRVWARGDRAGYEFVRPETELQRWVETL